MLFPMTLSLSLIWVPRNSSAMMDDDGDECKDERVLGETLTIGLVAVDHWLISVASLVACTASITSLWGRLPSPGCAGPARRRTLPR